MGRWGADNFITNLNMGFDHIVGLLNPKAKKAMYGAAMSKTIHKGTWNGCAFNAGGIEVGANGIHSAAKAAEVFDLPEHTVSRFISSWDSLPGTEEECTQKLIDTLERVGLFTEPGERKPRIIRKTIYAAWEKEQMEAVTSEIENQTLDGVCEAAELLFASV